MLVVCLFLSITDAALGWDGRLQLTSLLGRYTDPDHSDASASFEPLLETPLTERLTTTVSAVLVRPLDRYENWQVPSIGLLSEYAATLSVGFWGRATAVEVHRWALDGAVGQFALGPALHGRWGDFVVGFYLGILTQVAQYRLGADGSPLTHWGIVETLKVSYESGNWEWAAALSFFQRRHTVWENLYGIESEIAWEAFPSWIFGVQYQLLQSRIDPNSGKPISFALFDSRRSHFSGFVRCVL